MPDSLLPDEEENTILSPSASPAPAQRQPSPAPVRNLREFSDVRQTRRRVYDNVLGAVGNLQPLSNDKYTLRLHDTAYIDPEEFSYAQQKEAILTGGTVGRRLRGTWELVDNATGSVLDSRKQVIARVPYFTPRGTIVHGGNEYVLRNQQRLLAGGFTRVKNNGELEGHINVLPGNGVSHRYLLDPEKGIFKIKFQQSEVPLLPLLQAMGATDQRLREAWGNEIVAANYAKNDAGAIRKLASKLLKPATDLNEDEGTTRQRLVKVFENMKLDPEVTKRTLGKPHENVGLDTILALTRKLLMVSRREQDPDDRDALPYQVFLGPEDLLAERISKDHGRIQRSLLYKMSRDGNLAKMPSGALTPQLEHTILHSGLGQNIEEINPSEIFDKQYSVTRLGEGGIPGIDAIPDEARNVQPSHFGFLDAVRTPESFRAGVDLYFARGARKGDDGRIYSQFRDLRTGQMVWKSPQEIADLTVAFPGALREDSKRVKAMRGGKIDYVPRSKIDLEQPAFEDAFSPLANLVPLKSALKAQRMAMASRMLSQALPLVNPEAPLVQSAVPGTNGQRSFAEEYGRHMGAVFADKGGRVVDVRDGTMKLRYDDGSTSDVELYQNFPYARKTYIHQTPVVVPGQTFVKGQTLVRSNYTNPKGVTALGTNLRAAYWPYLGYNFEDAVVISESAASKHLASEHMYQHNIETDDKTRVGKNNYISVFPQKFDKNILSKLDKDGIMKVGQTVEFGEPLILATREREPTPDKIHRKRQGGFSDQSIIWEHHDPGVVTDVVHGTHGPVVLVKSIAQMQVGDKLSGLHGDKGIVAAIVSDEKMPRDAKGKPFEILLDSSGLISRTNPSQEIEAALGKLALHHKKPIKVPDFEDIADLRTWVQDELRRAGISDTESIYWPEKDINVPNIATGPRFFMKLHHTAESKEQARDSGSYTSEETPSKGGATGSKRISLLDLNALLSHGAVENLREIGSIRGQRNDDYWLQFMQGFTPRQPKVPMVYEKFVNQLKASGINVVPEGGQVHVMALTSKDVDTLAGDRVIQNGATVNFDKGLQPVAGGLFDPKLTGGHSGRRWTAIDLDEPMPNPVMEDPIRRILGLTQKQFSGVISGQHTLPKYGTGPKAIVDALDHLNLHREIALARMQLKSDKVTHREIGQRKLGFLLDAERLGLHPRDWVLRRVPVLPPAFRPVSLMEHTGIPLVADANYLYKELIDANDNLRDMKKEVGDTGVGDERLALYQSFKAVTGLGAPVHPKLVEKNVRGILKTIFGSSPKFSTVQRKLLSSTVDNVGRAVISPNPDYDMDTVGIPEDKAFDVYKKFLVRRLVRRNLPLIEALRHVKDRSLLAREVLQQEMMDRPVIINRAPVLHRFGIMAFRPRLVKGSTMQVSPLVLRGFNADFDGDAMQYHVVSSDDARKEALERLLPSRNLLSPADFKSPVHMPGQTSLGGLFYATRRSQEKQRKHIYLKAADALAAWRQGRLRASDTVDIVD